ncbi:MAG: hypothetical protein LBN29_01275 [Mediterranea sp.]|jgi:hypothetical protein|nr:hypothetical protein [Mediterranea sp.]
MKKENELQCVSYAQAKALEGLGFNWETDAFYATRDVAEDYHCQTPALRAGELLSPTKAKWYKGEN